MIDSEVAGYLRRGFEACSSAIDALDESVDALRIGSAISEERLKSTLEKLEDLKSDIEKLEGAVFSQGGDPSLSERILLIEHRAGDIEDKLSKLPTVEGGESDEVKKMKWGAITQAIVSLTAIITAMIALVN